MKKIILSFIVVLAIVFSTVCVYCADLTDMISISYPLSDEKLYSNPGRGWVNYGNISHLPSHLSDMISTSYTRFYWCDINPAENVFDFSVIDDYVEKNAVSGKQVAFGIMCFSANASSTNEYQIPKWIFEKGMDSLYIEIDGNTGKFIYLPKDWLDPIYIKANEDLANALAEHYDGDERIAFIDVRNYGNYGENHTLRIKYNNNGVRDLTFKEQEVFLNMYTSKFKKTKLVSALGSTTSPERIDYAIKNDWGIRYDALMCAPGVKVAEKLAATDGNCLSVFEFVDSYENMKALEGKATNRAWNKGWYLTNFIVGKPCYTPLSHFDNRVEFYEDNFDIIDEISNKIGYWYTITNAKFPKKTGKGDFAPINISIENIGVNNIYMDAFPAIALKNENGEIIAKKWINGQNARDWKTGTTTELIDSIGFEGIPNGKYDVVFGIFDDKAKASPRIKIGNYGRDENLWYDLADVIVEDSSVVFEKNTEVKIDGKNLSASIIKKDGIQYFPLREVFEGLGGTVDYNSSSDLITVRIDGKNLLLNFDSVKINNKEIDVNQPMLRFNGVSYISKYILDCMNDIINIQDNDNEYNILLRKNMYNLEYTANNGLLNSDFENIDYSWSFDDDVCSISAEDVINGKMSLKLTTKNSNFAKAYQNVKAKYGNKYQVGFKYKCDIPLIFEVLDDKGQTLFKEEIQSSEEVKSFQAIFERPQDYLYYGDFNAKLIFRTETEGNALVDDVFITDCGSSVDGENKIVDPGFEFESIGQCYSRGDNCVLKYTENDPHTGSKCAYLTNILGAWDGIQFSFNPLGREDDLITPGVYTLSAWVRKGSNDAPFGLNIYVSCHDIKVDKEVFATHTNEPLMLLDEWQKISMDIDFSDMKERNIRYIIMSFTSGSDVQIGREIYIDDVELVKK